MNNPGWQTQQVGDGKLVLHCGSNLIARDELYDLPEPQPMGPRHCPTAHHKLLDLVQTSLAKHDLTVCDEAYGITPDHNRFFGLLELEHRKADWGTLLALRSSHDQSMTKAISIGSRTFVCDNLSFTGQKVFKTKNTTAVMSRLPLLVAEAVGSLPEEIAKQERFFEQLHRIDLSGALAESLLVEMVRRHIVNPTSIKRVIDTWDNECKGYQERVINDEGDTEVVYEPKYLVDDTPRMWTLYNAATELWRPTDEQPDKPSKVPVLMGRTLELSRLFEEAIEA